MVSEEPSAAAIVLAGGDGRRFGAAMNKVFLPLAHRPVISWSLEAFSRVPNVRHFIVTVREHERGHARAMLDREFPNLDVLLVDGGESRHHSEYNALRALENRGIDVDVIAIHDGARPFISAELVHQLITVAHMVGGAVPALPALDLARIEGNELLETLSTGGTLVRMQTPQAFQAEQVRTAYHAAARRGFIGTDTASCVETFTDTVIQTIPGDTRNIKVTYPQDLAAAEHILAAAHHPGA